MDLKRNNEMILLPVQSVNEFRPLQTSNILFLIPTKLIETFTRSRQATNLLGRFFLMRMYSSSK